jgi:hypothetical protein
MADGRWQMADRESRIANRVLQIAYCKSKIKNRTIALALQITDD